MKGVATLMTMILLTNLALGFVYEPKERQLLYKEPTAAALDNLNIKNRVLAEKNQRKLGLMGPDDSEIVKIKAKKDMLKRKIEMDNGRDLDWFIRF